MEVSAIIKAVDKIGFAVVLACMFVYNSYENTNRIDELQKEYLISQKQDRDEYIKLNREMIGSLNDMRKSIEGLTEKISKTDSRIQKIEEDSRIQKIEKNSRLYKAEEELLKSRIK